MSDLTGPLNHMLTRIGRAATAERWAADIVRCDTPGGILISAAFRSTALAMSLPDSDPEGERIAGMESILATLVITHTSITDVATVAAIMDHVMTFWEARTGRENPDA